MKKKVIAMVLGMTMALSMEACGSGNSGSNAAASAETASETHSAAEETKTPSAVNESGTESAEPTASGQKSTASSTESAADSEEVLAGGWETNQGSTDPDDSSNKAAKEAFEKATKDLDGYDYELVAVLGSQVVEGTNYSYLVKGTPVTPDAESEYMIVVVYEDLEGNASVTGTKEVLDVSTDEEVDGGWSYNQGAVSLEDNADVKKTFEESLKYVDGVTYEPIAYIGSQVVSGTNYAVLCRSSSGSDAEKTFTLITIYAPLDGDPSISGDVDVDLSADAYDNPDSTGSGADSSAEADSVIPYATES